MKPKKVLYIAVGAPNSGKTTTIKTRIDMLGGEYISRDAIRFNLLKPGDGYFSHEPEVFNTFIKQIQAALNNPNSHQDVYADATHLNKASRAKLLNALDLTNVEKIIALYFSVPTAELFRRNNERTGITKIPETGLLRMYNSLTKPELEEHELMEVWEVDGYGYIKPNMDNVGSTSGTSEELSL